tara:strand:- start:852 stop:1136 length:285 start_codon:yes stop_codon:yes gene_type:complete
MKHKEVVLEQIVWCSGDDRIIYILRDEESGEINGLNFMQGDGVELFKDQGYNKPDVELTRFYDVTKVYFGGSEIDVINKVFWLWVNLDGEGFLK